jgi:putative PIN family toxin of toxin-antitoxin system
VSGRAVIVDTNVVVAGLLTGNEASPVAQILDGMLSATFPFVVSEALLAEYRAVLIRSSLRKLHGLTTAEIDTVLTELAHRAIVLKPPTAAALVAPDPGDQLLYDLLAARPDFLLITGDKQLLRDPSLQGRAISPQAFVKGA